MNYMKQVAEMLGLEWDEETQESEEFTLDGFSPSYKLMHGGQGFNVYILHYETKETLQSTGFITSILSGSVKIIKKPWKPKLTEEYYLPDIATKLFYSVTWWHETVTDDYRYKRGLVCRTKEEAIVKAEKIIKMLKESEGE